jgi:hypothetical protein
MSSSSSRTRSTRHKQKPIDELTIPELNEELETFLNSDNNDLRLFKRPSMIFKTLVELPRYKSTKIMKDRASRFLEKLALVKTIEESDIITNHPHIFSLLSPTEKKEIKDKIQAEKEKRDRQLEFRIMLDQKQERKQKQEKQKQEKRDQEDRVFKKFIAKRTNTKTQDPNPEYADLKGIYEYLLSRR